MVILHALFLPEQTRSISHLELVKQLQILSAPGMLSAVLPLSVPKIVRISFPYMICRVTFHQINNSANGHCRLCFHHVMNMVFIRFHVSDDYFMFLAYLI